VISHDRAPDGSFERLVAEHDGYRRLGLVHRRSVTVHQGGRWMVKDEVLPMKGSARETAGAEPLSVRLHWLLPDWPWEIESPANPGGAEIRLRSPRGWVTLNSCIEQGDFSDCNLTLARAGEILLGSGSIADTLGWVSPTYGIKHPALSFAIHVLARPPVSLLSEWVLP
jgi:hypothetical protein